ncbi:MAG: tetratricopeptide repeat protein [Litorimonas sp.]
MKFRWLSLAALIMALSATPAAAENSSLDDERAALLGDYLSGSYALHLNDAKAQSRFYQNAYERARDSLHIGRLALYSALTAGDQDLAKKTAERMLKRDSGESMARAVMAVDAFSRGRTSRVRKFTADPTSDPTMGFTMNVVRGWNAVDEGRYERARTIFSRMGEVNYFRRLGDLQIAKLEARLGNVAEAEAAFDRVEESGIAPIEYNLSRARFESETGRSDEALARLAAMVEDNPAAELGPIGDYLDRLRRGKRLPRLSEKAEAARALTDPAYAFFVRAGSYDGAETVLRFARWIDPDFDRAALWLASLIEDTHPHLDETSRAGVLSLYGSIGERSPYYVSARLSEANLLFDQDRDDDAIALLEKLSQDRPSYFTREALGRARFLRENWADALPFYTELVESLSEEELSANPEPLRLRGIIFERLDRWSEAEADFKRVLSYDPDDADTLNYLGYTWVDRGENLEEAFELIERAVELEPDSGAIVDSLGWAHYKLGRYDLALLHLEDAVELTPYSSTIIDHLGDVYWRVGRKREAVYQWRRALDYDPTDKERAAIQIKLDAGPNAVPAP